MGNISIILGKSGSGKSTSIKTLNPKESVVVNVLKKRLPFKGSSSIFNAENHNLVGIDTYDELIAFLEHVNSNMPEIKTVVVDDCMYIVRKEFFRRAKEVGYTKFTELAQHFQQIIQTCENAREDLNVFLMLHSEDVYSDKIQTGYKVATVGAMIDNQYNPVEVVPIVLYAEIRYDNNGKPTYGFYTHSIKIGTVQMPAKSPDGMFEEDYVPNDLGMIVNTINEYYK